MEKKQFSKLEQAKMELVKPVIEKLSKDGFDRLIERNLEEHKNDQKQIEFFAMLKGSDFFQSLYQEGVILGLYSHDKVMKTFENVAIVTEEKEDYNGTPI